MGLVYSQPSEASSEQAVPVAWPEPCQISKTQKPYFGALMGCLALSYYEQKLPPFAGCSVFLSTAKAAQRTPKGNEKSCAGSYKFGFNGQQKDNEIAGVGNHTTALFWEYDTRIPRRWNIDPKKRIWESDYSVFGSNPIVNNDVLGDDYTTSINGIKHSYRKQSGDAASGFYNSKGERYSGDNKFVNALTKTLDKLSETNDSRVAQRFNELLKPGFDVQIREQTNDLGSEQSIDILQKDGKAVGAIVEWNPKGDRVPFGQGARYNSLGTLAHEVLGHAWQVKNGLWSNYVDESWHPTGGVYQDGIYPTTNNFIGMKYGERDATSIENSVLDVYRLPHRPFYHGPAYRNVSDFQNNKPIIVKPGTHAEYTPIYRFPTDRNHFLKGKDTYE